MRRATPAALTFLLALASAQSARGQAPERSTTVSPSYSPYEQQTIDATLSARSSALELSPQGKIVEGIDVATLEVFEPRDPLPSFLVPIANWFHVTSRRDVIAREVLLQVGEVYDQALVDETARNLRGLTPLSLVLVLPVRGSAANRVRLLVITKDVWSLRLNTDWLFANGKLQKLTLQPSEDNLGGSHQSLYGTFMLDPATVVVGGAYTIPRLSGSRIRASVQVNAITNRDTGRLEGSYGRLSYAKPLYSSRSEWGWAAAVAWADQFKRRFIGGSPTGFDVGTGNCTVSAATIQGVPRCVYHQDAISGAYGVTRSLGLSYKHNVTLGFSADRYVYRVDGLSLLDPAGRETFMNAIVPVSDTRIGPYLEYHDYRNRYLDVLDLDTLGLTENVQVGHDLTLRLRPVSKALRSSRDYLDVYASGSYTVPLGDGLFRGTVTSDTEIAGDSLPDASIDASLRVVTPRLGFGRLVVGGRVLHRYRNYLNMKDTLGGDTALRGYPAQMVAGKDLVTANFEYRSDPIEYRAVHLGWLLFADAGDAFDGFDKMRLKRSCGMGLRVAFPQLQRTTLRVDVGFPLAPYGLPAGVDPMDVVVTFGQVLPELDPSLRPTSR